VRRRRSSQEFENRQMKRIFLSILFLLPVLAIVASGQDGTKPAAPDAEKAPPVSYGLVVDNSGSFRLILDKVIELTKDIVEENKGDDETFLVRFTDTQKIHVVQDVTSSKGDIQDAADNLYIESGQTAILDALYVSAKYLVREAKDEPGRQYVLVLISDGEERASATKYEVLAKYLKDHKITVFAIGIAEEKVFTTFLNKLTKESGGKLFAAKTAAEIKATVKSLAADMRKK
jgi:Mg-chelatase subunit ChlD